MTVGEPLPGSRNDCRAFTESGVDFACRGRSGDRRWRLPRHRSAHSSPPMTRSESPEPATEAENKVHRKARARVEHALSRLKNWKTLRDCRLKGV
ncbi:transposase family protein [Streptomyces sp. NPDC055109]